MLFGSEALSNRCRKYKICASFFLFINIGGCASLANLPVMGNVSEGVYTQPQGNFSCPLVAELIGLNGVPRMTDTYRVTRMEHIPLSERAPGDWRNNKVVSDETRPSRVVEFEDASGVVIKISSGRHFHPTEMTLGSGMDGGSSWRFEKREMTRSPGRMMTALSLFWWPCSVQVIEAAAGRINKPW